LAAHGGLMPGAWAPLFIVFEHPFAGRSRRGSRHCLCGTVPGWLI